MNQPIPQIPVLLQKLREIRRRALHIAEYLYFTRIQQSQNYVMTITFDDWKKQVREIELHIMLQEQSYLLPYHLDDYQPLGIFFDECYENVEHVSTFTPPQN